MYSLLLLSCLAVLAPVLAVPGAQYSYATSTLAPASTTNVVSYPTPTPTSASTVPPLPPNIRELKRREPATPAVFGKRQSSCSFGTFACSDGSGCCKNGELCYGNGYCYDPYGSMDGQISSLLAGYSDTGYDQASLLSFFEGVASTGSTAYQTGSNTNNNYNGNTVNVGPGGDAPGTPKKKSNTGMIAGIVVAVIVLAIAAIVIFFFVRRNKQRKEAAAAVQQPFVSQNPQPLINTTTPGPYPPTPGPYPPTPGPYPPTPGPYPPTPAPYSPTPGPYPPTPAPYSPAPKPYIPTPTPTPYDPYGGVGDKDKVPYYNNQPVPPNAVEMPANQTPIGSEGQHYQPPAAGIVEASGESVYRPSPTAGHPPGQPPANQGSVVYEMDSRHYGQQ